MKFNVNDIVTWHDRRYLSFYRVVSINSKLIGLYMLKPDPKPLRFTKQPELYTKLTNVEILQFKLAGKL
jgi:hypothetical protein